MKRCVVDLEMCIVPSKIRKKEQFAWNNELIQIGAVLLDDNFEVVDTFMTYVAPEFGCVTRYIEDLTGISQKDVREAPCAKLALESFAAWLPVDVEMIAWSDADELQIKKEMQYKNISIPILENTFDKWVDCQKLFSEKMHTEKRYRLSEALIIADADSKAGAHNALIDAHNTACIFTKIEKETEFILNPFYSSEEENNTLTYNPFATFFANYKMVV